MEEIPPTVSVTFSLTNPISETSSLGNHVDFTQMKIFTETAVIHGNRNGITGNGIGVVGDDIIIQESDADETMSVGDEPIEISSEVLAVNTSSGSLKAAVMAIEGIDSGQIVAKVISLEATIESSSNEHTLKASVMAIADKNHSKVVRSVFEVEYLPLWGSHLVCGKRPEMEDALVAVPQFMKVPIKMFVADHVIDMVNPNLSDLNAHFFGVYDGHGGSQVANYCRDRVHTALVEELKVMKQELVKGTINDGVQVAWEKAFTKCFQKVDDEVSGTVSRSIPEVSGDPSNIITSEPVAPETVGSTAVVALICSSHIVVANCGDSRAVLYRGKEAMALSNDHKPNREDEYARIEAAGGKVIQWNGHRVFGVLAMSRSIGDRYLKPWIIPEPEVTLTARAREDECLILASDGLWDVMSNEEACEVARKRILLWHKKNGGNTIERQQNGVDHAAQAGAPDLSKAIVNIQENAQGNYRVYEPGYYNISLPFVLSFRFSKTPDSTEGPLINAIEISKYVEISDGSFDGPVAASLVSGYKSLNWAQEGGDPCLPVPWSWLECNSDGQPKIISIKLSSKNITGSVPSDLAKLSSLEELWLDGNAFTGPIPDFSGCPNLRIIHLENNQLTGDLPSSLANLPKLSKLYVQNNLLSGYVPSALFNKKNIVLNYTGNENLHKRSSAGRVSKYIIFGLAVGVAALCIGFIASCLILRRRKKDHKQGIKGSFHVSSMSNTMSNTTSEGAQCFTLAELKFATKNFETKIGSGGFGTVYYGKLSDGKEIAVKLLGNNNIQQGKKEFANEVSLLSRIHHRNLVKFYGFCQEEGKDIIVYEFMHNGTLKEHLYGPLAKEQRMKWIKRLEIAEESAKGIEYLHTGCVPSIIHRDLKTSNILLDNNMKAKVSDFGLSKLAVDGTSHVSSIVRGTVGYLDPEYYISNHLTEKSDVYSFGVILLELISGKEAISNESFGMNCRNIVQWAKLHIANGDIQGIVDPALGDEFDIQSMWKIAEKALMCVQPHANVRPSMSEVIKEIQDAILIERGVEGGSSEELSHNSFHSSLNMGLVDTSIDPHVSFHESMARPSAR